MLLVKLHHGLLGCRHAAFPAVKPNLAVCGKRPHARARQAWLQFASQTSTKNRGVVTLASHQTSKLEQAEPLHGSQPPTRGSHHTGAAHRTTEPASHMSEIFIKDFALVSEQKIVLQPGLNVITGEPEVTVTPCNIFQDWDYPEGREQIF